MIMTGLGWMSRRLEMLASPRVTALVSMAMTFSLLEGLDCFLVVVLVVVAEVSLLLEAPWDEEAGVAVCLLEELLVTDTSCGFCASSGIGVEAGVGVYAMSD